MLETEEKIQTTLQFKQNFSVLISELVLMVDHSVKSLPAVPETQVQSLSQEIPLEKEMATHSSILAWRIPWTEEPDGLQSIGSRRVGYD